MLSYNTQQKKLMLPEYGRNVQSLIDYCLTIEDREERTRCANSIIVAMNAILPTANDDETHQKLWDHLAIMSDFKLDIDWPVEVVRPENLQTSPEPIRLGKTDMKYRHYGRYILQMIGKAVEMEEGPERDALVMLTANHMKKLMLGVNPEGVDDEKIFHDLAELSHGCIRLSSETARLHEFQQAPVATTGKKKKKKK